MPSVSFLALVSMMPLSSYIFIILLGAAICVSFFVQEFIAIAGTTNVLLAGNTVQAVVLLETIQSLMLLLQLCSLILIAMRKR